MDTRYNQSPASEAGGATALFDAAYQRPAPSSTDRACCCVAKAVVRVVMPPAPGRPHDTELLLCGHHYRVSRRALAAAHARVDELPGSRAGTMAWFQGDHDHPAHAAAFADSGRQGW